MEALESGTIPSADLYREVLSDRDRLLEEIAARNLKIADLERCLDLAADMVQCMQKVPV